MEPAGVARTHTRSSKQQAPISYCVVITAPLAPQYTMMYNDDPVYMRVQKLPAQDKRKLSKLQPMANMHAALCTCRPF